MISLNSKTIIKYITPDLKIVTKKSYLIQGQNSKNQLPRNVHSQVYSCLFKFFHENHVIGRESHILTHDNLDRNRFRRVNSAFPLHFGTFWCQIVNY